MIREYTNTTFEGKVVTMYTAKYNNLEYHNSSYDAVALWLEKQQNRVSIMDDIIRDRAIQAFYKDSKIKD